MGKQKKRWIIYNLSEDQQTEPSCPVNWQRQSRLGLILGKPKTRRLRDHFYFALE
jgi:hypothetical protein